MSSHLMVLLQENEVWTARQERVVSLLWPASDRHGSQVVDGSKMAGNIYVNAMSAVG